MIPSRYHFSIEPLEARIAPAGLVAPTFVSANKVIYTGPDGSLVTVTSSKPVFTNDLAKFFTFGAANAIGGEQLEMLNFTNLTAVSGSAISITAAPQKDTTTGGLIGSGFVNVGTINSSGEDLASVTVHGDLGQILVGAQVTKNTTTVGLGSLNVHSMGEYGTSLEQPGAPNGTESDIRGGVKSIIVAGDVDGVWIRVTGYSDGSRGSIGSALIGGNLVGGSTQNTGEITATDEIGTLTIKGSVIGGSAPNTGRIAATKASPKDLVGAIGRLTIGELVGGGGADSGEILSTGTAGTIKVIHDIYATTSSASSSGRIEVDGNITSLSIGGSLIGASHSDTGQILVTGAAGRITVGGDILGGNNGTSAAVSDSGYVEVDGALGAISVAGSIVSGQKNSTGALTNSGAIRSLSSIGSVTITGSLLGNSMVPVEISAEGAAGSVLPKIATIGSLSVGGSADYANILAGYDNTDTAMNGDVVIGKISVSGDWTASNAIAGFTAGAGLLFNNASDAPIGGATTSIISKISSIVIGGQISGTPSSVSSTDAFAFEADSIGSFKNGAATIVVGTTPTEITLSPETGGDVFINTKQSGA